MTTKNPISVSALSDISETLFYPLLSRYAETKKPNGILKDPLSVEIVDALDYDPAKTKLFKISQLGACLRTVILDEQVTRFLERHPDAVVVNLGCGLDTRFPRMDNGRVQWFDLDLPACIALRRKFFPETNRHRFISCSVLDAAWAERVPKGQKTLIIMEGLSFYLTAAENYQLLKTIKTHFPDAEILMEAFHPIFVNMARKRKYKDPLGDKASNMLKWGVKSGLEGPAGWLIHVQPFPHFG